MITMNVVNTIIIAGIVICALITVVVEDRLSAIISMGAMGSLVALEFLLLDAPDVAIAEGAVGAVLTPLIFLITLKKVKGGSKE